MIEKVEKATTPESLFGSVKSIPELKDIFIELAATVHPDKHGNAVRATEAFKKLTVLHREAQARITAGIYGTKKVTSVPKSTVPIVIERKKHKYIIDELICEGDICSIYKATLVKEKIHDQKVVLKIVHAPADNDLGENERAMLNKLVPLYDPFKKDDLEIKMARYVLPWGESFKIKEKGLHHVNMLPFLDGFYSLKQVHKAYPSLVFEDVVWVFNRMLEGLGYVHKKKVVHGAIVPDHFMVAPENHAGKFIDFSYAVDDDGKSKVKAIASGCRDFYAPEILEKKPALRESDIYMVGKLVVYLCGGNVKNDVIVNTYSKYFTNFIASMLIKNPSRRPNDAWALRDEFEEVMLKNYGKRKFHKFEMPKEK